MIIIHNLARKEFFHLILFYTYKTSINLHKTHAKLFLINPSYQSQPHPLIVARFFNIVDDEIRCSASSLPQLLMYAIVLGIGAWAMNRAIDHGFIIGPELRLPADFSPMAFPMGNAATGFFILFGLLAGVAGMASAISGLNHLRYWDSDSLSAASSAATVAWTLTLLAMGFACKEIEKHVRNSSLKTMEAFMIILSGYSAILYSCYSIFIELGIYCLI